MKKCSRCFDDKQLSEFYKNSLARDGYFTYCITCHRKKNKKWRSENREADRAHTHKSYLANREKRLAYDREYKAKNRDRINEGCKQYRLKQLARDPNWDANRQMRANYGITLAEYEMMLASQGGVCAICKTDRKTKDNRRLYVDHDHASGRVRAILCHNCNFIIGYAKDNPSVLLAAVEYLKTHETSEVA